MHYSQDIVFLCADSYIAKTFIVGIHVADSFTCMDNILINANIHMSHFGLIYIP